MSEGKFKEHYLLALKELSPYDKISIIDIVSLQGDDYTMMERELDSDYDPEGYVAAWIDNNELLDYLFRWYQDSDDFYMSSSYHIDGINTPFLGDIVIVNNDVFLFAHNSSMGHASLSKVIL